MKRMFKVAIKFGEKEVEIAREHFKGLPMKDENTFIMKFGGNKKSSLESIKREAKATMKRQDLNDFEIESAEEIL